jgi:hypothetical protein
MMLPTSSRSQLLLTTGSWQLSKEYTMTNQSSRQMSTTAFRIMAIVLAIIAIVGIVTVVTGLLTNPEPQGPDPNGGTVEGGVTTGGDVGGEVGGTTAGTTGGGTSP